MLISYYFQGTSEELTIYDICKFSADSLYVGFI